MSGQWGAKAVADVVDNWRELTLGDVCTISSKLVDPKLDEFIDLPHIGAGNLESHTGQLRDVLTARDEKLISGKFVFEPTMVLYSKIRPYLMKACRPNFAGLCSADIYPLTPKAGELHRDFLFHLLLSEEFTTYAEAGSARSGMPKVNRDHLFAYRFRLPPLNEQRRIVGILDEAFADIATATANAEKKVANARELFDALLSQIFGDDCAWPSLQISEFSEVFDGPHVTPKTIDEGPIFLGISALEDGELNLSKTRHVTQADFDTWTRRVRPRTDDVVFSYETRLGQAAIIPDGLECCLGRRMGLLRVRDRAQVSPSFLLRAYLSPSFQRFLRQNIVEGATVDRFSIKEFPRFSMRIPPMETQLRVVAACERAKSESDRIAELALQKVSSLRSLRQSLLHRAFSGELTTRELVAA